MSDLTYAQAQSFVGPGPDNDGISAILSGELPDGTAISFPVEVINEVPIEVKISNEVPIEVEFSNEAPIIQGATPLAVTAQGMRTASTNPRLVNFEVDPYGPWLVTIDAPHHQIHEGEHWVYQDVLTLGNGVAQDYLLTVPAGKHPHFSYSTYGSAGITVELFRGTGRTQSAAAAATFNRNDASPNVASMTIHKGTNGGSGDGTRIGWRREGTGTSGGKISGSPSEATERILAASTKYLFRVTSAAASNELSLAFEWYEEGAI